MAITLDATLEGEFSNSYVTVAEADSYFENHYNSTFVTTWDGLETGQKEMLLILATSIIEQFKFTLVMERADYELHYSRVTGLVTFYPKDQDPIKFNYFQALQFPRSIDIDSETGDTYIPQPIKLATFEQAISVKNFDSASLTTILGGIKSEDIEIAGQIKYAVTYQDSGSTSSSSQTMQTANLSNIAYQLLSPFIIRGGRTRRA